MRKVAGLAFALFLAASLSFAAPKTGAKPKTFVGEISDSMCGLKHMMPGDAKSCTLKCLEGGSKFVLADTAHGKVYELSDQDKPKEFAGQKVKVTGSLSGKTINVASIEAVQ